MTFLASPLSGFPVFAPAPLFDSEKAQVEDMLSRLVWDEHRAKEVQKNSAECIAAIRSQKTNLGDIEAFLQQYPLSSAEGRALMTLAEALLRVPDAETADALIAEKLAVSDWKKVGGSGFFASATNFGLGLAKGMLGGFLSGVSKPVIRKATSESVRRLGAQFVMGEDISSALEAGEAEAKESGYRSSFDMLGEGARTEEDAAAYFESYQKAALAIGAYNARKTGHLPPEARQGMSVKLSALHPRYHWTHADVCGPVIVDRLLALCKIAAQNGFTLTVDAEESERLELSLAIFARVALSPDIRGWNGLGLAVQAYDRRVLQVIDYIADVARQAGRSIQVRLVKGAYWDGEIKRAQIGGWPDYAVFTRKIYTDLSYLCAAQSLLSRRDVLYPMFATHNAVTAMSVLHLAGENLSGFEFQRLYGMGHGLGAILRARNIPVTLYAPVGGYQDLLPYLVRRMLENGANTSFVSRLRDTATDIATLVRDVPSMVRDAVLRPASLPQPHDIYGPSRTNSRGCDLSRQKSRDGFFAAISLADFDTPSDAGDIDAVFTRSAAGFLRWNATPVVMRAAILQKAADILEQETGPLMALLHREGKRNVADSLAEIREAVDFCRYYAAEGLEKFVGDGAPLPGPVGEKNHLKLTGRGIFVAISPWNFPLAIFMGQVVAALMAGNAVIAKPAEQTPRIGAYAVNVLHRAGVPKDVVQVVEGDGAVGARLVAHSGVAGVVFTGSTEVARAINRTLSQKDGPIVPLIAETGGMNAMIVDSTALPEQVVDDVLSSAFGSAGQRCSALRVLYLQNDIADRVIHLLRGAIPLLTLGNPAHPATDIPPVIDAEALEKLKAHQLYLNSFAKLVAAAKIPADAADTFFAPVAYEIDSLQRLQGEVFGPILHIIRYRADELHKVIDDINATGYGLTFGIHSRLQSRHNLAASSLRAGNIYINRNMIGAVVGVQPFGGQGLSGTGPKAGGPHYLSRFATEVTVTDNIMASGGNIDLLSGESE